MPQSLSFLMRLFSFIFLLTNGLSLSAQLISFQSTQRFTKTDIEQFLRAQGIPPALFNIQYDVDVYQVLYLVPYRHPDSLVQASGAFVVPVGFNDSCGLPLASYGHGTETKFSNVPGYNLSGSEARVAIVLASTGYAVNLPDYLGLGNYDPRVKIHPYQHGFSQAYETIQMLRASLIIADSIQMNLSGQIYLYGYSQGGFTTVAAMREIESKFPQEFNIVAAAPMSGAYDMGGVQADLVGSDDPYATPGYLPYLILAYQDQYGTLFDSVQEVFKAPFDSILPPLFYNRNTAIGNINQVCTPVPKNMIQDSLILGFMTDPNHRFRQLLEANEMLNWTPQAAIKLMYCQGDEQVTYLNSEKAYDIWIAAGAPKLEKEDFGAFGHNECALYCFLNGFEYFNSFDKCTGQRVSVPKMPILRSEIRLYPQPGRSGKVYIDWPENRDKPISLEVQMFDIHGRLIQTSLINIQAGEPLSAVGLSAGIYHLWLPQYQLRLPCVLGQ